MNLTNKTILITGAANGLGRELSLLLDGLAGSLVLVDRDAPGLASLSAALTRPPRAFPCDLSDLPSRKKLIEQLTAGSTAHLPWRAVPGTFMLPPEAQDESCGTQGKVDILINCAGIGSHSTLSEMSVDEVERVMQVNALAPLELTVGLAPLELVVNIGSVAGELRLPSIALYAAGKSALHAFTRCIELEGARTLLVILGPLGGTDFVRSIERPRTSQPGWYRRLDLPATRAAGLIVKAMKRGQSQLVAPGWYRLVFVGARWLAPVIKLISSLRAAERRSNLHVDEEIASSGRTPSSQ